MAMFSEHKSIEHEVNSPGFRPAMLKK